MFDKPLMQLTEGALNLQYLEAEDNWVKLMAYDLLYTHVALMALLNEAAQFPIDLDCLFIAQQDVVHFGGADLVFAAWRSYRFTCNAFKCTITDGLY